MEIKMVNQIKTEATFYVRFDIWAKQDQQIEIKKLHRPNNQTNKRMHIRTASNLFSKIIFFLNQHDMKEKIIIIDWLSITHSPIN